MKYSDRKILTLYVSFEIYIYGLLGIFAVRNVYYFLIKQNFYKNCHLVTFYVLTFGVLTARITQFVNLARFYNSDEAANVVPNDNNPYPHPDPRPKFCILPI